MINVDNKYNKRIFSSSEDKGAIQLKRDIYNKINEIESRPNGDYNQLVIYENLEFSDNISVIKYKKSIDDAIEKLIKSDISFQMSEELKKLKKDIYKILIGDIHQIKEYIDDLVVSNSLLIHRDNTEKSISFNKYQAVFENLYKTQLSGNDSFKKSFFNLFRDLNVCPYCNRNFINPIYKSSRVGADNKKQSPDIEHFFPKSIYPFLSLSISNLLPSCSFCNKIKSDVDTYNICKSPYEIQENDFVFEFDPVDSDNIKIVLKTEDTTCKNSEVLHLNNLYNEIHSKYVNDIFSDVRNNPESYREFLKDFFNVPIDSQEKMYHEKFRNYYKDEDLNKHPLSKMTKDLFTHIKNYEN